MIRVCWFIVFALISTGAYGQTIRSGAHTGFTRLVFPLPQAVTIAEERKANEVRLIFSEPAPLLNPREVFRKITRNRLSALNVERGALSLSLNCNCPIRLARQGRFQIVDILDPLTQDVEQDSPSLPAMLPAPEVPVLAALLDTQKEPKTGFSAPLPLLQKGLTEGVLRLREDAPESVERNLPNGSSKAPMRLRSAFDPEFRDLNQAGLAQHCAIGALLQFPKATTQAERLLLLSQAQSRFDLEDRSDADVLQAARQYIALGFGTEALAVLETVGSEALALRHVARRVEGSRSAAHNPFEGGLMCANQTSLWALLSYADDLNHKPAFNRDAIYRAFTDLPVPMKTLLRDDLMDAARRLGAPDLAERFKVKESLFQSDDELPEKSALQTANPFDVLISEMDGYITQNAALPEPLLDHARALMISAPDQFIHEKMQLRLFQAAVIVGDMEQVFEYLTFAIVREKPDLGAFVARHLRPAPFMLLMGYASKLEAPPIWFQAPEMQTRAAALEIKTTVNPVAPAVKITQAAEEDMQNASPIASADEALLQSRQLRKDIQARFNPPIN